MRSLNEVIRELHRRKSVRAFTEQPIDPELKREILEAAMAAPTAGNQQMYTILDITDPALRQRLAVTCDNQPFIARAQMVLIFCADFQKWYDAFAEGGCAPRRPGVGDLMLAVTDAAIAAQNAVTAAQSLGVGSCYIGDILENCEIHRELLNLPEYVFPAAMLAFGYPTQQQLDRPKPERCSLEDIVCENTYWRKDGAALRRMFAGKHPQMTFEEWSRRFCSRKYNSDFSREMTRSVGQYLQRYANPAARWCDDDDCTESVITADRQVCKESERVDQLPETALVFFMGCGLKHLIDCAPSEYEERRLPRFLNATSVYVRTGGRLCLLHGGYGAPQAADTVETLAELGVRRILCVGMCGGFGEGVSLGDIILPDRAYVEEGTSLHYYETLEYAEPDAELLARVEALLPEGRRRTIVTTDSPYRQTFAKEALWRDKGAVGVEMETSAAFSVGRRKGLDVAAILTVSDRHPASPEVHDSWEWHMPREAREHFAERCLEVALKL